MKPYSLPADRNDTGPGNQGGQDRNNANGRKEINIERERAQKYYEMANAIFDLWNYSNQEKLTQFEIGSFIKDIFGVRLFK